FWTYTCVNWLRTLPYVRAWAEKYRDQGLLVVGVHTPEFPFEKDIDNVRWAAKEMDVKYPSRSTANIRSGGLSTTSTGPPCISPMWMDAFGFTISAKVPMIRRRGRSKSC